MNLSEEKQKLYARLHDWMYQESLRLNRTPLPKELEDPEEWAAFVKWRNDNWRRLCNQGAEKFDRWLDAKEGNPALALAETPPPYPSKN